MIFYLLDTNILLHLIRDNALGRFILAKYGLLNGRTRLFISIVTEAEIRALALQYGWGEAKRRRMENVLSSVTIFDIDHRVFINGTLVENYTKASDFCRANGRVLSKNDLWIAASAMATQTTLLTTDKDFTPLAPLYLTQNWINPAL